MRIVSKVKDYYDVGQGLGYDPSVVYVRTPKEIVLNPRVKGYPGVDTFGVVGFCGKLYPFLRTTHHLYRDRTGKQGSVVAYTVEQMDRFVAEHYSTKEQENYHAPWATEWNRWGVKNRLSADWSRWKPNRLEFFAEHNTPVFIEDPGENLLKINGLLRPYGFAKVFDPYLAYQEIAMFVGGVLLAPVNPVPPVSDEDMRDAKGFDKWSFRREPMK
jgi:hypothetical protein